MLNKPRDEVEQNENEQNDFDCNHNSITQIFSMDEEYVWPGGIERESYVNENLTEPTVVLPVFLMMLDQYLDAFMREDLDVFVYIIVLEKREYEF